MNTCPPSTGSTNSSATLYRLNAEEPELPDFPWDPKFLAQFGPRNVLDCKARPWTTPRWTALRQVGKQTIKDASPLTKQRMETCDDEFAARSVEFLSASTPPASPCSSG